MSWLAAEVAAYGCVIAEAHGCTHVGSAIRASAPACAAVTGVWGVAFERCAQQIAERLPTGAVAIAGKGLHGVEEGRAGGACRRRSAPVRRTDPGTILKQKRQPVEQEQYQGPGTAGPGRSYVPDGNRSSCARGCSHFCAVFSVRAAYPKACRPNSVKA